MKFTLTEPKKQFSSEELLIDLKSVAINLNQQSISIKEYAKHGKYSPQTLKKRFGSWKNAIIKAGLRESKRSWGGSLMETSIPEKNIINDLIRVSHLVNGHSLTLEEYKKHGNYSTSAVSKRWGNWNKAKEKAGLPIGRLYNTSDEEYFLNLANLWQKLGRQPKYQEVTSPLSKLHVSSYERKYGSWRGALEAFVEYMNNENYNKGIKSIEENLPTTNRKDFLKKEVHTPSKVIRKRTNRIANLRQRFLVMKRDNFKCVICGASPASNPSVILHIDHIVAWSKGGETVESNLRTLCQDCNLGKSNIL